MSVAWTQNGDGEYLVESAQHLLQIMNEGGLYADTGTPPTDYLASSYLQTSDIDLVNDHASIVPIGNVTTKFTGEYNGGSLNLQNWSYTGSEENAGLFGYCDGATLKHIRLTGVWTCPGSTRTGFLGGRVESTTIHDIEGDFSAGTTLDPDGTSSCSGTLVGYIKNAVSLYGATVCGTVTFGSKGTSESYVGGLVGYVATGSSSSLTMCRNLASFPNGISGQYAGGLIGLGYSALLNNCLNGMTGDIVSAHQCGGIIGKCIYKTQLHSVVNSMTGDINGVIVGGIVGFANNTGNEYLSASKLFNYMKGDIEGSNESGGIVGRVYATTNYPDADTTITKSVVAMQGNVNNAVFGATVGVSPSVTEVTVDTSFGMTYTTNDYGLATMVVDDALVYHPGFTDLPYVVLEGTDADGTIYNWDFVYANIGGKNPAYTHLSVHTGQVSAPYFTDFGLATDNTVVYLTYANTGTNTLHYSYALTVVETAATSQIVRPVTKYSFLFGDVYDITEAGPEVEAATNDLFTTGDRVGVAVNSAPTTTTFVNRGGDISIVGVSALLLPFDPAVIDVQDATLTLSDATSVDVGFDQASGQISVGGTPYGNGEYFIVDGQKVTVRDI